VVVRALVFDTGNVRLDRAQRDTADVCIRKGKQLLQETQLYKDYVAAGEAETAKRSAVGVTRCHPPKSFRTRGVDTERKAGLTRFILQRFFSLLSDGSSLALRRCSRITPAHTRVLPEEESTPASDRGAFTNRDAPRFEVETRGQTSPRAWAMPGR